MNSIMKHIITYVLFIIFSINANAQFVNISNEYLKETIKEKFPDCINLNDELDTTCTSILQVDSITFLWRIDEFDYEIDLSTLKYFKNLDSLALVFYRNSSLYVLVDFNNGPTSLKKLSTTNIYFNSSTSSWSFKNLPPNMEEYYGQAEDIKFLSPTPNLKKIKAEFTLIGGGGAVNLFFPDSTLPEKVEELEMNLCVFWLKPNVPSTLRKLHLVDLYTTPKISVRDFLSNLPNTFSDLKIENANYGPHDFIPEQLPENLNKLYLYYENISDLNLPPNLKELYLRDGNSKISQLPHSLTSVTISNYLIEDPLQTFNVLPTSLKYFDLSNSPMLVVPDLPLNTYIFKAQKAQIQTIGKLSPALTQLYLGSNNIRRLPSLPALLRTLDVQGNPNLECLPILNDSLRTLTLGINPTFKCIPNETKYIKATPNRPICLNTDSICEDVAVVKGVMYYDANKNGVLDSDEMKLSGGLIESLPSKVMAVTGNDGAFSILLKPDTINNISALYNNPYISEINPASYDLPSSSAGQIFTNYNFGVTFNPASDLESFLVSNPQRPGMTSTITATILNRTITNYDNVSLKVFSPDAWSVISTSPIASKIVNDTVFWENISLSTFQSKKFEITTYISPSTALGTIKTYTSDVQSAFNDETPLNNVFELKETVVGSFDPNDKLVDQKIIQPDYDENTELIYTIRFQNTGTDTAFNVVIKDSILSQLNPLSVRTISSSHDFSMEYKDNGVLYFNFYNILLPDSNRNESASHGYVILAIKPQSLLPIGTIIENFANIYFDFNDPITTNSVQTIVNTNVSVDQNEKNTIIVYPNPSNDVINIEHPYSEEVFINLFDINGRLLHSIRTTDSNIQIPVHQYAIGVYFLSTESNKSYSVEKILIQR